MHIALFIKVIYGIQIFSKTNNYFLLLQSYFINDQSKFLILQSYWKKS